MEAATASMIAMPSPDHDVNPLPNGVHPGDMLTCQWQGCIAPHHPSPEALYEHVCETHIGRKSTNNLNLQCFWGNCRTTTVKRDHITSHIRVHVPLKPHKCDCGKAFKRPQDLKKHVKTHADESVLFNSPQPGGVNNNNNNARAPPNGYQAPTNGKQDGSYPDAPGNQHLNYPYANPQTASYNGANMSGSNFAPLYAYGGPQASSYGGAGLTESRKRTHDALNDFFGQAKRRNIDAGQYQDLGAQFSQFLSMFAPMTAGSGGGGGGSGGGPGAWAASGYNAGYGVNGFDNGGAGVAYQTHHAPPMGAYNTPFPELRTKSDLMSIDQFLEQLQNTVYENSTEATPTTYNPIAGMQSGGFAFPPRTSNSPPHFAASVSAETPSSSSYMEDTPALTPHSFQTNTSPQSSARNLSPNSRPAGSSLYPTLPSFDQIDRSTNAFGLGHTTAPHAGLGPQYEGFDERRRYSGGQLQRARQSPPAASDKGSPDSVLGTEDKDIKMAESGKLSPGSTSPTVKLPGVSEITRSELDEGEQKESVDVKADAKHEAWLMNIRLIEGMRDWVRQRLNKGEYERDSEEEDGNRTPRAIQDHDSEMKEDELSEGQATTPKREGASLYPMLRPVEA